METARVIIVVVVFLVAMIFSLTSSRIGEIWAKASLAIVAIIIFVLSFSPFISSMRLNSDSEDDLRLIVGNEIHIIRPDGSLVKVISPDNPETSYASMNR